MRSITGGITMPVMKAIRKRRSIRKYERRDIPDKDLLELLEAARLAPSGANRQPWELIVVTDEERKNQLVHICNNQKFIADCSAFLAGVDDPQQKWARVDLAIALDHLSLAAADRGLGTCWIGAFDRGEIAKFLGVPDDRVVTVCMTLGYPSESPDPKPRKDLKDLIHWNQY